MVESRKSWLPIAFSRAVLFKDQQRRSSLRPSHGQQPQRLFNDIEASRRSFIWTHCAYMILKVMAVSALSLGVVFMFLHHSNAWIASNSNTKGDQKFVNIAKVAALSSSSESESKSHTALWTTSSQGSDRVSGITKASTTGDNTTHSTSSISDNASMIQERMDRVRTALWSYFAGDALAAPTHWFYGGIRQVQQMYGPKGITGYTKPVQELPGSIMNKSNLSGGGRASTGGGVGKDPQAIIGHVINHGKQDLWSPNKQIHYHATLQAGENTLEVQLGRVLMKSIVECGGTFNADHFRKAYMDFMMTPGSHNDAYASTCHRMFFANLIYNRLPPEQCPDNDQHNVDTVDGLVLPTIAALAVAASPQGTLDQAAQDAAACAAVTRNSRVLQQASAAWGRLVFQVVRQQQQQQAGTASTSDGSTDVVAMTAQQIARSMGYRKPQIRSNEEMTACYLDSALPALLDSLAKVSTQQQQLPRTTAADTDANANTAASTLVWNALLVNANTGGENVHRGSCLGAVLGANAHPQPINLKIFQRGLHQSEQIEQEIEAFLHATSSNVINLAVHL